MPVTRRALLQLLSSSTFFLTASRGTAAAELPGDAPVVSFPQGVASGDPRSESVMLWTRAVPESGRDGTGSVPLLLQLSKTDDFSKALLQVELNTGRVSDFTVRAYVDGLEPDTTYYYRFAGAGESRSRLGRTRTAPAPGQDRTVNLAFASCQNFEQAYFGAWARMLEDDEAAPEEEQIQFVLHLGDFIYERCWHHRPDGSVLSRLVQAFPAGVATEKNRYAVSLEDYRHLYQTYLSDPHLQAARARWPFICTWDDHEFSNDNFQAYSTYGEKPVLEARRKKRANRAWFEYIPSVLDELVDQPAHDFLHRRMGGDEAADNQAALDTLCIYRKLNWGKNLDLVLTDSRSYRSAPCLPKGFAQSLGLPLDTVQMVEIADAGTAYGDGNPPASIPVGKGRITNPALDRAPGTCLGLTQRDWLLDTLESSQASWKVWGNALPLLPLRLDMSALPFAGYQDSVISIDGWAGYPHEQKYLMQQLDERKISGVVSLSGDHHMHGAGAVGWSTTEPDARPVAVDFNVAAISSTPLFEELEAVARQDHPNFRPLVYAEEHGQIQPVWNMTMLDGVFAASIYARSGLQNLARWLGPNQANRGLKYVDSMANGYGLARFSGDELRVQLVTMNECRSPFEQAPAIRHVAKFRVPNWQADGQPQVSGPEFEYGAPFPFEAPTV